MACKYYLGKQIFKSELALEEYLLNNSEFIKEHGDEVFSYSTIQNQTRQILIESDRFKRKLYKEGKIKNISENNDLFESYYQVDRPYYGTNSFLKHYTFIDGDGKERPLFPIFDLDSFITNKSKDWKSMEYWNTKATEEEIYDIFQGKEPHPITTKDELDFIKEMYKSKWLNQSLVGSAVHDAMNLWWRAKPKEKSDVETFTQYLKNNLKGPIREGSKKYEEIIPEHVWEQIAQHCYRIEKELKNRFGKDAIFMSEIGLTSDVKLKDGTTSTMVGVADLIVIDKKGNIQILDYKTSPKVYGEYNSAKKRTFYYQLAVYRRMAQRMGLNVGADSSVYVIPMQFQNFKYDYEKDQSTFDNLISEAYDPNSESNTYSYLEELPVLLNAESENIRRHLDAFIPLNRAVDLRSEDISEKLNDFVAKCFPSFADEKDITDERIIEKIKRQNKFEKDPNTHKYSFKWGNRIIEREKPEQLVAEVKSLLLDAKNQAPETAQGIKHAIKEAQRTGVLTLNTGKSRTSTKHSSDQWLQNKISRYISKDWNILDGPPILEQLGIILFENVWTHQVNIIKISNTTWQDLDDPILLGGSKMKDSKNNRHALTGNFESDLAQKQKPKSLVLDSNYGNIELMQTMAVMDMLPKLFSGNARLVGDIEVINAKNQQGMTASNKQLLYNYKELRRHLHKNYSEDYNDQTSFDSDIHCLTFVESVKTQFKEVINGDNQEDLSVRNSVWKDYKGCVSDLDNFTRNPIQLRQKLIELAKKLEQQFKLTKVENFSYDEGAHPEKRLYYTIHMAIAEIDGIDYVQQTRDHDSWLGDKHILTKGLSGTMYDNPGNMESATLNNVSKQVNVAYQNVRNDIVKLNEELRKRINALKKSKNFNWVYSRTIGNQTDLYKNLYDETYENDIVFKNPWDEKVRRELSKEELDLLEFVLFTINGSRYNLKTEEQFKLKLKESPLEFLSAPLTEGSFASKVSRNGMLQALKDKFKILSSWKYFKERVKEKLDDVLIEDENTKKARSGEMWEMINRFDSGDDFKKGGRERTINAILKKHPDLKMNFFEHNVEILCLKHKYAYSLKKHLDKVFPTIKAAMLHLSMQGIIMNDQFEDDIQYLNDFIKSKIFNFSIQDDKWKEVNFVVGEIMSGASKLALAFSPRQLYQSLDGFWKDISLYIRKPDGDTSFTAKNLKDSFFWIYKDLMHFGNDLSMAELINQQYGLNDMDMNSLIDKISSDNVGIWNFWNIAFKFASRPDFYNRMTIFGAQMRGDGCFEAHSVKDGKLVYDMSKDKRFNLYSQGIEARNINPKEYDNQKALYIAMAKQFMAEHAVDSEGKEFILDLSLDKPKSLPRAYTTQQSESMKSLSDLIYGYYSHEKKALVQSTTLGALIMQMNTYWSSKKNQWLAPGGVKQMGKMEQYEEKQINIETGKEEIVKYWVEIGEDGNPTGNPTTENTGIPYMQWKGQYQEGIIVTISNMIRDLYQGDENGERSLSGTVNSYWNNDDLNLRRAYRNNLKQLLYDLFMLLFLGVLVSPALINATKKHIKDVGNDDFVAAFTNNCAYNLTNMLSSSADDFNVFHSLFGKGIQWTPFAVSSMTRTFENLSNMITGKRDLFDVAVNMASATRSQEPLLDFVKISTLGREIGDNGE